MSALFSPIRLRELELKNRIVVAAMSQYSADEGRATDWHKLHIGNLAMSGAAMFVMEATAVEPLGRITPTCLGLWDDATELALGQVIAFVRQHARAAIAIQLAHAGRKASSYAPWDSGQLIPVSAGGWQPVAPSAIPHKPDEPAPDEIDGAGMDRVRQAFASAAQRAGRIGIDAVELHCAHGYLLHEFLSPLSNHRTDRYGGSLENRMRYPLDVFDAVRAAFPAGRPVGVRVSATDWVEGGWDLEQTIAFAKELKRRGVDFIDVSSGGLSPLQQIPIGPGYQVPLAQGVKDATGLPTIAVGMITQARQADDILSSGKADLIGLARAMLFDPRWGWHAAVELDGQVDAPRQYWRSQPATHKALFGPTPLGAR